MLGALAAGAYFFLPKILPKAPATNPVTQPVNGAGDLVIPNGIKNIMANCWASRGKPTDRGAWVAAMQTCAMPLPNNVWAYVYDQSRGEILQQGIPSDEASIKTWLTYAWQQRALLPN